MSEAGAMTIRTERLKLRMPDIGDFAAYAEIMASPRSVGMGGPFDLRAAWGMFCHDVALWQLFGHGALTIELGETGECVGQVGINHGPLFPEKELGWFVYEEYEGKGYATEAALALRDWAFATLKLPSLVSYIAPGNAASVAVAERLGARLDPTAPRTDPADLVYRHLAS
ncbi:GNAT family N-acetyltransferase [Rhizobium laguerreae]|uniref:GNAT family N-acetyltransferase n=1 Tax=Rhizobium laguerreae TaxID=1076926 RepID=A0AAJ3A3V0_9HYPH|nr:GNAT family N-acetyltransferase [Rhizobium laguerreae]MBY3065654.1 GNAT family N-acetyltransferase [Rhizobium laguerreae]MBY3076480.1 GNAT family N-acetyltransferase [Rhizobium laguerreae]MBY3111511.1 GNAT family N-acetyltransferase [Rhizobium laguerreae]MBY3241591.1 GNAT family N-acetyltransferase [Rhizobium laguerreae]MBY3260978.1 GNAT family N-acetyltransferase [Rhizobium laguerreae]